MEKRSVRNNIGIGMYGTMYKQNGRCLCLDEHEFLISECTKHTFAVKYPYDSEDAKHIQLLIKEHSIYKRIMDSDFGIEFIPYSYGIHETIIRDDENVYALVLDYINGYNLTKLLEITETLYKTIDNLHMLNKSSRY